jgi:hypothetical protein
MDKNIKKSMDKNIKKINGQEYQKIVRRQRLQLGTASIARRASLPPAALPRAALQEEPKAALQERHEEHRERFKSSKNSRQQGAKRSGDWSEVSREVSAR